MWWDYSVPRYVEVAMHLAELQKAGKIRHIGVTNFDVPQLEELLGAGCAIISNQVQYSVLDQRPARAMCEFARQHGMSLLCYGAIAGGFLADKYLGATQRDYTENRSLVKYRLIIEEMGGFDAFQRLLRVLKPIADKNGVGIAEVAACYVLQQPSVAGVIVGARHAGHLAGLRKLATLSLDEQDMATVQDVVDAQAGVPGGVYELERDRGGRHGRIMRYNLNAAVERQ
jgi:aryl-alcohol dehydrogenase-like predicted oxidoreductase